MLSTVGYAQRRQLLLLKGQKVIKRFIPGDDIRIKLKDNDQIINSYINNLTDTSVFVHTTNIAFENIERVYFHRATTVNKIGTIMVIAGTGLFLIDQFNVVVVNGDEPNIDAGVAKFSIGAVVLGLPMMLIKKKYIKTSYKYKLRAVEEGSMFYLRPPSSSPYIH